jgi:hypothetical protein
MTSLADDLLRSRSVGELRELVNSLERDSSSRKTELQQMVGSKYHDFIQSADKITKMKEKSIAIEEAIEQSWQLNQSLIAKSKTLLLHALREGGDSATTAAVTPIQGNAPLHRFPSTPIAHTKTFSCRSDQRDCVG